MLYTLIIGAHTMVVKIITSTKLFNRIDSIFVLPELSGGSSFLQSEVSTCYGDYADGDFAPVHASLISCATQVEAYLFKLKYKSIISKLHSYSL